MENENNNILPHLPTELDEVPAIFLPEDGWSETDISDDWLDPTEEWEKAKNAMFIGDAPICTLGGVTILTGQSGNGKTMTTAMMIATAFVKEYGQFKLGSEIQDPTVLYIDTEMEKYNTQRLMGRVYYITGWEFKTVKPQFRVLRLRDTVNVKERWKKVLKAIYEVKPTFCILDGLIDLVEDFNDNKESQALIRKIMAAATWYDMSVIGIIHQNPAGDKMAGHLGSFGERKAICVLATKKDKTGNDVLFIVEQKKARDKDAEDVKFTVNDDNMHIGIPQPLGTDTETERDRMCGALKFWMAGVDMNTRDLRNMLMNKLKLDAASAMEYINKAVEWAILEVNEEWNKDHTKCKSRHYHFVGENPF